MLRLGVRNKWRHHGRALDVQIRARLNHGRWICDCPFCPGAELADGDRFLCQTCRNAAAGGRYVEVIWPDAALRRRIVRTLAPRPIVNRNWQPGEPLELLEAENIEHGVSVL